MSPSESDGAAAPRSPRHVYLVEADPAERERFARVLAEGGYAVTVVPTLEAAITEGFWSGDPADLVFVTPRASART